MKRRKNMNKYDPNTQKNVEKVCTDSLREKKLIKSLMFGSFVQQIGGYNQTTRKEED